MRIFFIVVVIIAVISLALIQGCATYRSGRQLRGPAVTPHDGYTLGVVEVDDQGRFWNAPEVDAVLDVVRTAAAPAAEPSWSLCMAGITTRATMTQTSLISSAPCNRSASR